MTTAVSTDRALGQGEGVHTAGAAAHPGPALHAAGVPWHSDCPPAWLRPSMLPITPFFFTSLETFQTEEQGPI